MSVVCTHCGYENSEHYRFCGMCGAVLPAPEKQPVSASTISAEPVRRPSPPAVTPAPLDRVADVSGPSFLGLSEQPKNDVEYLLQDEESHDAGRRRMYAALLLLVVAGILVLWQSRRGGLSWLGRYTGTQTVTTGPAPETNLSHTNGPQVDRGASAAPAPSMPLAPSTTSQDGSATPPPAAPSEESHMVKPEASGDTEIARKSPEPKAEAPGQKPTADNSGTENSAADNAEANNTEEQAANNTEERASTPSAEANPPAAKTKTPSKPTPTVSKTTEKSDVPAPTGSADDRLVADGERYLYGTGTAENCELAQKNLRAAAAHSNPRALSMLGAMYATGHCVERDLPSAYRSFARALHQDRTNARIQQDLEVLWRQMSAEERQAAMKNP
jgi:hypothetical protein